LAFTGSKWKDQARGYAGLRGDKAHPGDKCGPLHWRESGSGRGGAQMAPQLPTLQAWKRSRGRITCTAPCLRGKSIFHWPGIATYRRIIAFMMPPGPSWIVFSPERRDFMQARHSPRQKLGL